MPRSASKSARSNGTYFSAFEKLLGAAGLNRPYVIVRDGDRHNGPNKIKLPTYDDGLNVGVRAGEFVTATTLEYAITRPDSLDALGDTCAELGIPQSAVALKAANGAVTEDLQKIVLTAASRAGKGRFAQLFGKKVLTRHLSPPDYIRQAIETMVALRTAG